MESFHTIIFLLSVAILLVGLTRKMNIPYPIGLVLGGAALGFIPHLNLIHFDPTLVLVVVLPPILYQAAYSMSLQDFKKEWKEIFSLAFSLVIFTTIAIGLLFKWMIPQCPWALAFAFGAIVSPPDAAAATAVLKRFPIGNRLSTILEGESLVNDASALVLYRLALVALLSGTFSWFEAGMDFVKISTGGILVGLVTGVILQSFSKNLLEPAIGVVFSFVIPYITYGLADLMGVSGVLAVVVSGLIGSRVLITHHSSLRRVLGIATWDVIIIIFNCFVFVLIGSELNGVTQGMNSTEIILYSVYGFIIMVVMMLIRMMWVYLKHLCYYIKYRNDLMERAKYKQLFCDDTIIGWSGMRGIVSLTAALALPYTLDAGAPLACRSEVIYIVFVVIMLTLLIPGLTLPSLIRWLNLPFVPENHEADQTRKVLVEIAEELVNQLVKTGQLEDDDANFLTTYFNGRYRLLNSLSTHTKIPKIEMVRRKVLRKQRAQLVLLWEQGKINDKCLFILERELDFDEVQSARVELS